MATGDNLTSAKAWAGGIVAAVVGFLAPGAAYLLTVDGDGVTSTEWTHAVLISVITAAVGGGAVGVAVHLTENKLKTPDPTPPPQNG